MRSPWLYVYEDIMGNRTPSSVEMDRGTASEAGVALGLTTGASLEDCQAHALKEFDRLTALVSDPKRDEERAAVPGIVEQGLLHLRDYGKPTAIQQEFLWQHPDLPVPFKGFIDFLWEDHGVILDMKSESRLTRSIKADHSRQVSLYGAAISDNYSLRVGYFTPKKGHVLEVENPKEHLKSLVNIVKIMDRLLDLSDDPKELLLIYPPNPDGSFPYRPAARQAAYEISGI